MVTEDFARQLGFKTHTSYNTLSGVGGVNITTSNKTLNLFIESKMEDYWYRHNLDINWPIIYQIKIFIFSRF